MKEEYFISPSQRINQPINNINLTSLIDVTLVVLIIFILISPMIELGIDIDLPQASRQKMTQQEAIIISVAKENTVYLDNAQISILKLEQRLKQIKEANPKVAVTLRGDKSIPYKNIIAVLDMVKKANIDRISLAVKG